MSYSVLKASDVDPNKNSQFSVKKSEKTNESKSSSRRKQNLTNISHSSSRVSPITIVTPNADEEDISINTNKSKQHINKRLYHNEVERQRRNKIAALLKELGTLLKSTNANAKDGGSEEELEKQSSLSKIQILEKACEFVEESKNNEARLSRHVTTLAIEKELLKEENEKLKKELEALRKSS